MAQTRIPGLLPTNYVIWRKLLKSLHASVYKMGIIKASLVSQMVKNLPATQETWVQSLGGEDPLEEEMAPYFIVLPGKFHRQRELLACNPWGHKSVRHNSMIKQQQIMKIASPLIREDPLGRT